MGLFLGYLTLMPVWNVETCIGWVCEWSDRERRAMFANHNVISLMSSVPGPRFALLGHWPQELCWHAMRYFVTSRPVCAVVQVRTARYTRIMIGIFPNRSPFHQHDEKSKSEHRS